MSARTEWVVLDTRALRRKLTEDREYQHFHALVERRRREIANLQDNADRGGQQVTIDELMSRAADSKKVARELFEAADRLSLRMEELLTLCQVCWAKPRKSNRVWQGETLPVCSSCLLANDGS